MAEHPEPSPQFLDLSQRVDGPFVATYTAHLPFPIGIPHDLGHMLFLGHPFMDASATEIFGPRPWVRINVFDTVEQGLPVWRKGTHGAIKHFYGVQLDDEEDARYGEDNFTVHDQWVTLETPHAAMEGEDPAADLAFSFHRCLNLFNLFLETSLLLTGDIRIRRISTYDLRPAVVIGALERGKEWRALNIMQMHIAEARHEGLLTIDKPFSQDELNNGIYSIVTNKPYMNTAIWRSRAQRALRQTGDAADAIISFQVAAESMLFDTYRMLLVDEGRSSAEIAGQLSTEIPFYTLLTRKIPEKLGGRWDVTRAETAIGQYWANLYLMRNSIIHTALQPHGGHAQAAQSAYWTLRDYLEDRLWEKRRAYPRTLYVRIGKKQLTERGLLTSAMRSVIDDIDNGPQPFYWPYDLREPPNQDAEQ